MKAKDVRKGNVVVYKNAPHRVAEAVHRTPGNLRAFVQMKLRNLMTGMMTDDRFSSFEELPDADVFTFKAQYLYSDDSGYHFMDVDSYEQLALDEELVGDNKFYLVDNMNVEIMTFEDKPIGIQLPKTVELVIEDCAPELRGATASNSPKPAKTNTGLSVNVPAFLKIGDRIVVDTTEGEYLSRAD